MRESMATKPIYIYIYIYIYIHIQMLLILTCSQMFFFWLFVFYWIRYLHHRWWILMSLQTVFLWEHCTNIRCSTTLIFYGKTSSLIVFSSWIHGNKQKHLNNTCKYQVWFTCSTCWTESVAGMTQSLFTSLWLDQCAQSCVFDLHYVCFDYTVL